MASETSKTSGGPPRVYATRQASDAFVRRLLGAHGVPAADAAIIANCLVRADLRGVDTHGIVRLPGYLDRVRKQLTNTQPKLVVEKKTPVAGLIDGQNGFGFLVGTKAMAEAVEMAKVYGIGMVGAKHSNHFGMAASYVLQALEAGYIGLVFSNASPAMPPWGGKDAFLGTSPLAIGAPGGKLPAILLDMAPSVVARGKIRRSERLKQTIPLGYALDAEGRPTTDPTAALGGVVLPIGGYKGSGLAVLMDVFGGVFTGAGFAGDVGNQYQAFDKPQDVGHFFLAIKPGLFMSDEQFRARMDHLVASIRKLPKAEGFTEILLPGEIEFRLEAERLKTGIPYSPLELGAVQKDAEMAGVALLEVSEKPY